MIFQFAKDIIKHDYSGQRYYLPRLYSWMIPKVIIPQFYSMIVILYWNHVNTYMCF